MFKLLNRIAFIGVIGGTTGYCAYNPKQAKKFAFQFKQVIDKLKLKKPSILKFHNEYRQPLNFESLVRFLGPIWDEKEKNEWLKEQINYVSHIEPDNLQKLMNQYWNDNHKLNALKIIEDKIPVMRLKEVESILKTSFSENVKLEMLNIMKSKILILPEDDVTTILNTFWENKNKKIALEIMQNQTQNPFQMSLQLYQNTPSIFDNALLLISALTFGYYFGQAEDNYIIINGAKYNKKDFIPRIKYIYKNGNEIIEIVKGDDGTFTIISHADDMQNYN